MLSAKLQAIGKNYSKYGSLIGESKSCVKVYEKVMGNKRVLGSYDRDGQLIKKVVTEKNGKLTTTKVFDSRDRLVRETSRVPETFSTAKINADGNVLETLNIAKSNPCRSVELTLGEGDKAVFMRYTPTNEVLKKGPTFHVECGKSAINNACHGIEGIDLPNGTWNVVNGILKPDAWKAPRGDGDFAQKLYEGFNKLWTLA